MLPATQRSIVETDTPQSSATSSREPRSKADCRVVSNSCFSGTSPMIHLLKIERLTTCTSPASLYLLLVFAESFLEWYREGTLTHVTGATCDPYWLCIKSSMFSIPPAERTNTPVVRVCIVLSRQDDKFSLAVTTFFCIEFHCHTCKDNARARPNQWPLDRTASFLAR